MVNTIFILDEHLKTTKVLAVNGKYTFFDDLYTLDLSTGAESYEFSTNVEDIEESNYIMFYYKDQYKLFQIIEIEQEHSEGKIITTVYGECACLELLNGAVRPFEGEYNAISFFTYVLEGTGWSIGNYSTSLATKIVNVKVDKTTQIWSCIQDYMKEFGYELNTRVIYDNGYVKSKLIDIYAEGELGEHTYKRFEYGRNVEGITKKKDLYDFCTALIIDTDQDITNITYNQDGYVKEATSDVILATNENRQYNLGRPYIYGNYEDDSPSGQEAVEKAVEELKRRAVPHFDYECTTACTYEEYEDMSIGDTVYVIDHTFTPIITLEARIGVLEISFTNRNDCKCNLTNYKEIKSKISVEMTGNVRDIVESYFPITSSGIADGAIIDGKIDTIYYQQITADIVSASKVVCEELIAENVTAINGRFENLSATYATIEYLNANYANIEHLNATYATIENLTATNATIDNLKANYASIEYLTANYASINYLTANYATITQLNAANGYISTLQSDVANIQTLINGNLTSDNIQSLVLTADKVTIADALIKDAMIYDLSASKINTGILNTNNVVIQSDDGSMLLQGTLQQFKDKNGTVRIQIGKDTTGNFTFVLYGEDGTGILLDQDGIKASAVADGLIVDAMVSDEANISGGKLDISSVISHINDNENTLLSSKIRFSDTDQTLDVAFNSLKTRVDTIENVSIDGDLSSIIEQVNTNTTNIAIAQGEISTLISNTTITKENGEVVQLKDEFNSTKDTVDSHTQTINYLETNYQSTLKSTTAEYYVSTSSTEVTGGSWSTDSPTWEDGKYVWQRMKYTYTDNTITYGTPVCIQGAKGANGLNGKDGEDGTSVKILGSYNTLDELNSAHPSDNENGDGYIINGDLYVWDGAKFLKVGQIKGEAGDNAYVHIKYSNDGGNTFTSNNGEDVGEYMGVYADNILEDSTNPSDYTWSKILGEKGQSLVKSTPQWYKSTSSTTQTGGSWVETMPTVSNGYYIWLRYKLDWENPTATTYTTPTLEQVAESVKEVSAKQSELQQDLDGFKLTVSSTYQKIDDMSNYSTTEQMNSAITQKANEITSSVSSTYATKTDLSTANSNITSLTTRMNTAESKLTTEGLTTTIGSYYTTSTDVDGIVTSKGYATTSEVQQTASDLTATFNNGYYQGITQMNADGVKVYHTSINDDSYTHMSPTGFYLRYKGTDIFKVDSDGLIIQGYASNSWVQELSDTYYAGYNQGITQITSEGVKVFHSSIDDDSYTHMSPSGFYIKYKGSDIVQVDSNGILINSYADDTNWTDIQGGYIECGGTIDRYWLGNEEASQTIKLKSENGKFRARNDYYNRSVYFSDQGLSTTANGEIGSSGIVDFHNDWYGYGNKGLAMYSNHHVSMIAYNGFCNISPEWNNTGNNTFSFQVLNSDSASGTHGLIYYGSHVNGYSTCIQVSKDANDPGINILDGNRGDNAYFQASHLWTSALNNNYWTNGTLTMNQMSQGSQGGTQTYLSGTTVSATTFYQSGSTVSTSDIILKDNIYEYKGSALDIINKTKIYTFNRITTPEVDEIGFIAQQAPDELVYKRGEFTAEELDGLTADEKTDLLARRTKELLAEAGDEECELPISMMNQNNIIAIMFKAIQELKAEIDNLKIDKKYIIK